LRELRECGLIRFVQESSALTVRVKNGTVTLKFIGHVDTGKARGDLDAAPEEVRLEQPG